MSDAYTQVEIRLLRLLFIGVASLLLLWFVWPQENLNLNHVTPARVARIELRDHGIIGTGHRSIRRADSIATFCRLMHRITLAESNLNVRANRGVCDARILYKDGKELDFTLTKTICCGGLLRSDDSHFYYADSLLDFLYSTR